MFDPQRVEGLASPQCMRNAGQSGTRDLQGLTFLEQEAAPDRPCVCLPAETTVQYQ